jgi:hypothetical protein
MRALSTSDVSLDQLRRLSSELGPDFELDVDERQIVFKSVHAPSWIMFFANADWWVQALGAYAAIYVAEIVKEAGKQTWKDRARIGSAVAKAGNRIRQFAVALSELRTRLPLITRLDIGLDVPNDYDGTRLELVGTDAEELAVQLALFITHLPAVANLIHEENLIKGRVATGIQLVIRPDASLEIWWQDGGSLKKETRILPLRKSSDDESRGEDD